MWNKNTMKCQINNWNKLKIYLQKLKLNIKEQREYNNRLYILPLEIICFLLEIIVSICYYDFVKRYKEL